MTPPGTDLILFLRDSAVHFDQADELVTVAAIVTTGRFLFVNRSHHTTGSSVLIEVLSAWGWNYYAVRILTWGVYIQNVIRLDGCQAGCTTNVLPVCHCVTSSCPSPRTRTGFRRNRLCCGVSSVVANLKEAGPRQHAAPLRQVVDSRSLSSNHARAGRPEIGRGAAPAP